MSNSPLTVCTILSPNNSGKRTHAIDRITIHCVVGQCSAEALGYLFADRARYASSNYGVDTHGRVGLYVPEDMVSWCSSSGANDNRAVTIETASDNLYPYAVTPEAYAALLDLCEDVCRRNGKTRMVWLPTKEQRAACQPGAGEMLMTVHRDYANKSCPGEYLYSRMGEIAEEVNARLAEGDPSSGLRPPSPQGEGSDKEEDGMRYNTIEELPEWGRETVVKLCEAGVIRGRGAETDEAGHPTDLDLSDDMLRLLVMLDRAGALEREVLGVDDAGTTPHQSPAATASPQGEASAEGECGDACGVAYVNYDDYTMI